MSPAGDESPARVIAVGEPFEAKRLMAALDHSAGEQSSRLVAVVPIGRPAALDEAIERERPTAIVLLDHDCSDEDLRPLLDIARRRHIRLQVRGEHLGEDPVCLLPGL